MATSTKPTPPPTTTPLYGQSLAEYIIEKQKSLGRDPNPELAVIPHEGGFYGAVGDQGTSFGPFQLHIGGALPRDVSAANARAWANSPAGIDYALGRINSVVGKDTGTSAVADVVYRFERPADPLAEYTKAEKTYFNISGVDSGSAATGLSTDFKDFLGLVPDSLKYPPGVGTNPSLTQDALGGAGSLTSGIGKLLGVALPKNSIQRGGELLAGGVLVLLGLVVIGVGAAKSAGAPVAPAAAVVTRAARTPQRRRTAAATRERAAVRETRTAERHESTVKLQKARATELRSRSRARSTRTRLSKEQAQREYRRGALDQATADAAPNLAAARKRRAA